MEFNYPSYTLEEIIGISIVMLVLALFSCLTDCFIERKKNKMEKIKLTDENLEIKYFRISRCVLDNGLYGYYIAFVGRYRGHLISLMYSLKEYPFSVIIDDLEESILFEYKKFTEK